jgi:hypothetical protein
MVAQVCNPNSAGGIGRGITIQGRLQDKNGRSYLKKKKKGWGQGSSVQCPPSNCEALVQNPVLPKKKKKCMEVLRIWNS